MTCFFYSSDIDRGLYEVISNVTGYTYDLPGSVRESATGFAWKATTEGLLSDPVLKPLVLRTALLMIAGINPFSTDNQLYGAIQPDNNYSASETTHHRSPATIRVRPETLASFADKKLSETEVKKFMSLIDLISCLLLNKLEPEVKAIALHVMQKLDVTPYSSGRETVIKVVNPEQTYYSANNSLNLKEKALPLSSIQPNAKAENIRLAYLAVKSLHSLTQGSYFSDCVCPLLTLKNCPRDLYKEITEVAVRQYLNGEANHERYELEAIRVAAPRLFKQSVGKFITVTGLGQGTQKRIKLPLMTPKEKLEHWWDMPRNSGAFSQYSVVKDREVQNYLLALRDAS